MKTKLMLEHQAMFLQAPFLFPKLRWFILCCGYGAGKTSSLAAMALYLAKILQGKKDKEGHKPRILLGGVTLAHLQKTTLAYILEDLEASKSKYVYDKKNNILHAGDVDILITPLQNPETIMGYDCCFGSDTEIFVRGSNLLPVLKKIIDIEKGDEVWTRNGWAKVTSKVFSGVKETMCVGSTWITPDQKIWNTNKTCWAEAQDLIIGDTLYQTSTEEIIRCQGEEAMLKVLKRKLSSLTGTSTTDTRTADGMISGLISTLTNLKVCMLQCGKLLTGRSRKAMQYIMRTLTRTITVLKILNVYQTFGTQKYTMLFGSIKVLITRILQSIVRDAVKRFRREEQRLFDALDAKGSTIMSVAENLENLLLKVNVSNVELPSALTEVRDIAAKNVLTMLDLLIKQGMTQSTVKTVCASFAEKHSAPQKTSRLLPVRRTVKISKGCRRFEPVWDITVEREHEFFTKDFLAHNCCSLLDEIDDLGNISRADDITFEAVKAVNERTRQVIPGFRLPFLAMASTSQGQRGLYRIYTQFKKAGTGFILIRGKTKDNFYLPKSYVNDLYRIYDARERRVYLEGEFLALASGRVFSDFDWDRNFINEDYDRTVQAGETVYWGQDFNKGMNRGCAAVLRQGVVYVIKRYDFPEIRDAPSVVRHDFPHAKIKWIPDTTAKDQITHFAKELRKHDIHLVFRGKNPLTEDTVFLVNKLLYTRRLIVTRMAKETAEALALEQRDKNHQIAKGKGPNDPQHDTDGVRYICYFLATNKTELRDIRRVTIQRHLEMEDDENIVMGNAGYAEIPASMIAG